jgi:hypothetical protein
MCFFSNLLHKVLIINPSSAKELISSLGKPSARLVSMAALIALVYLSSSLSTLSPMINTIDVFDVCYYINHVCSKIKLVINWIR